MSDMLEESMRVEVEEMDCKDDSPVQAEIVESDFEDKNIEGNADGSNSFQKQSDMCSNDQIISLFATLSK